MKYLFLRLLFICCILLSCNDGQQGKRSSKSRSANIITQVSPNKSTYNSNITDSYLQETLRALLAAGIDINNLESQNLLPTTEVKHIIDPEDGNYKLKVSIPKNYDGLLYISGLNTSALRDKLITVRFKFGRDLDVIDIPATIGRAEGLTPQTNIEVLILDLRDQPFKNVRLLYDLYDYNYYSSTGGQTPKQDPADSGLFCRGLKLEHDPTFRPSTASNSLRCENSKDICHYAYAKVIDTGLYHPDTGQSIFPEVPLITEENLDGKTAEYNEFRSIATDSTSIIYSKNIKMARKCLPDSGQVYVQASNSGLLRMGLNTTTLNAPSTLQPINYATEALSLDENGIQKRYIYKGPYRSISKDTWEIRNGAIYDQDLFVMELGKCKKNLGPLSSDYEPKGLFRCALNSLSVADGGDPVDPEQGIQSYLFPLATKLEINTNTPHFSSISPLASSLDLAIPRNYIESLAQEGESLWMDGCNARAFYFNPDTNEHIGSCNVSASISLVYKDPDGAEMVTVLGSETAQIKLQLVRESSKDFQGNQLLFSSFPRCSNSAMCGPDSCCFNNRCWDKKLVSQCVEDATSSGSKIVGETCSSDLECSSLCCNRSLGRCSPHEINGTSDILCSKSPGDSCIAKEFCRKDPVRECFVVKTGVTPLGVTTCAKRCYLSIKHGDCVNGKCEPPTAVDDTTQFDPNDPNRCEKAIDPPTSTPIEIPSS